MAPKQFLRSLMLATSTIVLVLGWLVSLGTGLSQAAPVTRLTTSDPVVDGRLDSSYTFFKHFNKVTNPDPKLSLAPGDMYIHEGASACYWAFVVDRAFNDNVYAPKSKDGGTPADEAYLIQDGWVKSGGSVLDHDFKALHKSDHAKFAVIGSSDTYSITLDLLHQTKKDSTNAGDYTSGVTGADKSDLGTTPDNQYVDAAATSLHWNINNSNWSDWFNRSPAFDYNTTSGNHWEWHIIYEFSILKSDLSNIGITSGCGDVDQAGAHNSPNKNDESLASVGDYVWKDANGDGLQNDGGVNAGIENVTVYLKDTSDQIVRTTQSDPAGHYIFNNLAAGNYYVEFMAPPGLRFTSKDAGSDDTLDSDADPNTGKTATFTLTSGQQKLDVDAGFVQNPDVCYGVADSTTSANDGSQLDTLAFLDRLTGATSAVGSGVGNTARFNIEAIAFQPGGSTLYAADANQLGTLDLTTGAFTATASQFGTGSGSAGHITFSDVDGLTFDSTTGILYGTHRRSGNDLLFRIDPSTGAHVPNAFGSGVDYVEVQPVAGLQDVDDIAVDPVTGVMYATVNNGSSSADHLVIVNKSTGATTDVGTIQDGGGSNIQDIEGLAFFNDGKLYGSSGKSGPTTNGLYQINETTAVATLIGQFTDPLRDFEGLACLTANAALVVEKSTNDQDADTLTGPYIREGATVTWTYGITNTGGVTITNISVTDDKLTGQNPICTVSSLAPGAGQTCQTTGVAALGQYTNTATATGTRVDNSQPISDTDPSHYFGVDAYVTITPLSATNPLSVPHTFTITVVAEGKAPNSFSITPSVSPPPDSQSNTCGSPTISGDGKTATCTLTINHNSAQTFTANASATVTWGSFSINVTTDGAGQNSGSATKTYKAPNPDYVITKTNITDPNLDGVRVGDAITFTVHITNTGDVTITVLPLRDTYVSGLLAYIGATPPPDTPTVGQLEWNDLTGSGAGGFGVDLAPGQSFSLTVQFVGVQDTTHLPGGVTKNTVTVHDAFYDPDGSGPAGPQPLPDKSAEAPAKVLAPTAVALANHTVGVQGSSVMLTWETVNETDLIGFNLYRQVNGGTPQRINAELIPAAKPGQASGAVYSYRDETVSSGELYRYLLEIVDVNGSGQQVVLGDIGTGGQIYLPGLWR